MATQLFVPTYRVDECLQQIRECLEVGWTGLGFKTVQFEDAWKKYTGLSHAHFLNSATAGLHMAVKILKEANGWNDGDEIISTPLTFVSTNHAIAYEHLKIVFADIDEHLCLDPVDIEKKITPKTRAVMFVGMGGNAGQYLDVVALCKKYGLRLILDAAHMAGTRLNDVIPGKEADCVVYSFQAVKNLPTGDSGMICFADEKLDALCRKLSWLGISKDTYQRSNQGRYSWKYDVDQLGFKYHGNSIMAAIGLVQLKYLDQDNDYRRQLAQWYDEVFADVPFVQSVPVAKGCESSRHLYIIRVPDRDALLTALHAQEIYPGVHYRVNTEYPLYEYARGTCPQAETISDEILSLPLHLRLKRNDIEVIGAIVMDYVGDLDAAQIPWERDFARPVTSPA